MSKDKIKFLYKKCNRKEQMPYRWMFYIEILIET